MGRHHKWNAAICLSTVGDSGKIPLPHPNYSMAPQCPLTNSNCITQFARPCETRQPHHFEHLSPSQFYSGPYSFFAWVVPLDWKTVHQSSPPFSWLTPTAQLRHLNSEDTGLWDSFLDAPKSVVFKSDTSPISQCITTFLLSLLDHGPLRGQALPVLDSQHLTNNKAHNRYSINILEVMFRLVN